MYFDIFSSLSVLEEKYVHLTMDKFVRKVYSFSYFLLIQFILYKKVNFS